jgi:hypothetical protein
VVVSDYPLIAITRRHAIEDNRSAGRGGDKGPSPGSMPFRIECHYFASYNDGDMRGGIGRRMLLGGGCVCLVAGFVWHGWANVLWPVAFALSLLSVGNDLRRALPHRRLVLVVGGAAVMLSSAAIHRNLLGGQTTW